MRKVAFTSVACALLVGCAAPMAGASSIYTGSSALSSGVAISSNLSSDGGYILQGVFEPYGLMAEGFSEKEAYALAFGPLGWESEKLCPPPVDPSVPHTLEARICSPYAIGFFDFVKAFFHVVLVRLGILPPPGLLS